MPSDWVYGLILCSPAVSPVSSPSSVVIKHPLPPTCRPHGSLDAAALLVWPIGPLARALLYQTGVESPPGCPKCFHLPHFKGTTGYCIPTVERGLIRLIVPLAKDCWEVRLVLSPTPSFGYPTHSLCAWPHRPNTTQSHRHVSRSPWSTTFSCGITINVSPLPALSLYIFWSSECTAKGIQCFLAVANKATGNARDQENETEGEVKQGQSMLVLVVDGWGLI